MTEPIQFAVLGLGAGAIYALVAQGLVLVYRGSGIINFAQGAIGMIAALLFYAQFRTDWGWPTPLALAVALVVASLIGAGTFLGTNLRLRDASALTRTFATLGVLVVLQSFAVLAWGTEAAQEYAATSLLPQDVVHWGDYSVGADRLWLTGLAVATTVVLWAGSRFTLVGLATSAAAESEDSAAVLGWSPRLIGLLNWAAGAAFAGLAGVLIAPISGLDINSLTFLVVNGLAAALVGQFVSFPLAFAAAMTLGIVESEMARYVTTPGFSRSLPFLAIVLVLALRGKALPLRSHVFDRMPALGTGAVRVRVLAPALALLVVVLFAAEEDWVTALTSSLTVAILMLSLVVVTGYSGQISLAQYALAGLAAWAAGRLVDAHGWPFEAALLAGIATATGVGLLFAVPALRTRGVSLAIVTLGLGIAAQQLVYANQDYTGGLLGTVVGSVDDPLTFAGIDIDAVQHPERYAVLVLAMLVSCGLAVANLRRSRAGRRLVAVRTNERAAAALGISVFAAKLYAFALGSAIAGLGGVVLAFRERNLRFDQFDPFSSITLVAYLVVGGIGFISGAVQGGTFAVGGVISLVFTKVFSTAGTDVVAWVTVLGGLGLFAVILQNPDGLAAAVTRRRADRRRRPAPAPDPLPDVARSPVRPSVLEVSGLTVRFGGVTALDDVSLAVRPGQVVGLIGPNGAGKTTLVDAVTGYARPVRGETRLDGRRMNRLAPHRRARAGISRSFQSLELFEDLSVRENLQAASDARDARAYASNLVWREPRSLRPAAVAAVREFDLEAELDQLPRDLSYGHRRLTAIARAVATEPSILLLDEPAAGLGDLETAELGRLVRRLADDWGLGILVIEHDMRFVMDVCDIVVVLDFGRVIAAGPPSAVANDHAVRRAYLGAPSAPGAPGTPDAATTDDPAPALADTTGGPA